MGPAALIAQDRAIFDLLYQLVSVEEMMNLSQSIRNLLLLMPTDPAISDLIDSLATGLNIGQSPRLFFGDYI